MTCFEFFSITFSEISSYFSNKINRLKIINFKKVRLTFNKKQSYLFLKMVPNIDKYWLLAGPWTVLMHGHVRSFNQSQTQKSRSDVWIHVKKTPDQEGRYCILQKNCRVCNFIVVFRLITPGPAKVWISSRTYCNVSASLFKPLMPQIMSFTNLFFFFFLKPNNMSLIRSCCIEKKPNDLARIASEGASPTIPSPLSLV